MKHVLKGYTPQQVKPVLHDKIVVDYLNQIHSKFVLVPNYKAENNIAIICKRFYIEKLLVFLALHLKHISFPREMLMKSLTPILIFVNLLSWQFLISISHFLSCIGCLKCITVHAEPGLLFPELYVPLNHSVSSCQQFTVKYLKKPEIFILNASFIRIIINFG